MTHRKTVSSSETEQSATELLAAGRLDEASRVLAAALAFHESSELWNDWAVVQLALAERAFNCALMLDPWNGEAAANLGVLLFAKGKTEEAGSFLKEALQTAERPARVHIEALLSICASPRHPTKRAFIASTLASTAASIADPVLPDAPAERQAIVEGDVDLVVQQAFFADPAYRGTMVEVGAAKPDYLSVSATFRSRGWRVLSIEPNPYFCELQRRQGFEVIECACGDADRDDVNFFVVKTDATYKDRPVTNESFSSLGVRGKYAEMMKTAPTSIGEIKVKVRRLDTILREHASDLREIDVVCIDVEG